MSVSVVPSVSSSWNDCRVDWIPVEAVDGLGRVRVMIAVREQAMMLAEQQAAQFKEAHEFVKQMIDQGEIQLDDNGSVMPLNSKQKC